MKIIDEVYPLIKCEARLSDDGTLWIKTDTKSAEQTKRVLIEYAENSFCKTFYQDCDEPPTTPTFVESADAVHNDSCDGCKYIGVIEKCEQCRRIYAEFDDLYDKGGDSE